MTSTQPPICDWQTSRKTVTERGLYLFETGAWSDCRFIVGSEPQQQIFKGHKLFLAMSSPVFEAMFYGGMAEKKDPIAILDVQPDAFKTLLEYIYTDRINLTSFDQACELCYCGKKYMLPHLVEECTKYLWSDLYPKNACRAYEFAKLFEEPILMEKCINIIRNQTREVLSESSFDDVELSTIGIVFEQNDLNIQSELELFTAITRYANHHNQNSEGNSLIEANTSSLTIRDVLMKIRFLTLTPQEFAEGPATSHLLTESEKFAILMNISSLSTNVNMPQGFSTSRIRRVQHYSAQEYEASAEGSSSMDTTRNSVSKFYDNGNPGSFQKKFFCVRDALRLTECTNSSILDCTVTFTCDRNVCILGIQVPSQTTSDAVCTRSFVQESYTELLYAHLLDGDGSRLTYTHFTARVTCHSLVDIMFNRPIFIQRNKAYKVGVVLHKTGVYPIGTYPEQSLCNGVTFTFTPNRSGDLSRDGLIRTIIFSAQNVAVGCGSIKGFFAAVERNRFM